MARRRERRRDMIKPTIAGPEPHTRIPHLILPDGVVDSHFHIFGDHKRFPYAKKRSYSPPECSVDSYIEMRDTLNLQRGIVVQPSIYGTDNSCLLDAIHKLGPDYRGVAIVKPSISEKELEKMTKKGVRGARLIQAIENGRLEEMIPTAEKIRDFYWHIELYLKGEKLASFAPKIRKLNVDVVIDHIGHFPTSLGTYNSSFKVLLTLLETGKVWVKLSGPYRSSLNGPPYKDVIPFAKAVIQAAPERIIWGTDWPHTNVKPVMPNDADILDLMTDWAPDDKIREQIFIKNPEVLYGLKKLKR